MWNLEKFVWLLLLEGLLYINKASKKKQKERKEQEWMDIILTCEPKKQKISTKWKYLVNV